MLEANIDEMAGEVWLLVGIYLLISSILIYLRFWRYIAVKIDMMWIALAICPAIIWLLASGKISEISGFGFNAKLATATGSDWLLKEDGEPVPHQELFTLDSSTAPKPLDSSNGGDSNEDGGGFQWNDSRDGSSRSWIAIDLDDLQDPKLTSCLSVSSKCLPAMKHMILVDDAGRFIGLIWETTEATRFLEREREPMNQIDRTILETMTGAVVIKVEEKIGLKDSRGDVLKYMLEHDMNIMPVVDENGKFIGILSKNAILENVVVDLIGK